MSDSIGERVLLPSFKMAQLVNIEPDGRKVYADAAGVLLCEHGELASTIGTWLLNEKTARLNGEAIPARQSACTCKTTEGLHKAGLARDDANLSEVSLFDHLQFLNTDEQKFKGREARHIPFTHSEYTAFVTVDGRILCKHGRSRLTLQWDGKRFRKDGKVPTSACGCKAFRIPKRAGHSSLRLGSCGNRRLTKLADNVGHVNVQPATS